jgi:4,5-dihydroxyphthalate decarboxylase
MPKRLSISVAVGDYDRVAAIKDGRVQIEGCDVTFLPLAAEEVFFRAFRSTEFDVTELSFSSTLIQTARGDCQYVGIPAFVSRVFRHGCIYIRTDRGIREPADLKGRLVGLPEYQMTAPVWMRGMLQDEYGVKPEDIAWRSGGQEQPGRDERTRIPPIPGLDLKPIPNDRTLVDIFVKGELDALFTARAPSCFVQGAPNIGRLFPNYREVEKAYWRKTKLFPIMHLVGIRKTLLEREPWLATSVYKAFVEAKELALQSVRDLTALNVTLPWVEAEALETIGMMGQDYWRYGVKECAHEIDTICRYSFEQGLSVRRLTAADIFAPQVMEVSKI